MNHLFINGVIILLIVAVAGCASSTEREADLEKKNKRAETHVMLGASYLQRGQLDVAKEELEKALSDMPDNSQANNIMGVLQWRLNKYDEADRLFRKALDKDAGNSSAHHNYGAFLCDRGKLDAGVRHFDTAAADALYTYTAEVNLNAGLCLMKKPAPAAAEKYFREALRINPRLSSALYQMARLSANSGQRL
ncbi:MAG: type IV pilus biogenesis/stability protein PilW, partial [Sulfuricaulis sp.]|nr:type IV pilus biogenesis/stability protein PilW [Sulfuricaulis sp.]